MHIMGAGDKAPSTKKSAIHKRTFSQSHRRAGDAALTAGAAPSHHSHVSTGRSLFTASSWGGSSAPPAPEKTRQAPGQMSDFVLLVPQPQHLSRE